MEQTDDVFSLVGPSFRAPLRSEQLRDLTALLSHAEIRELSKTLSEVDFRFDIISNLPPELLLLVADSFILRDFVVALDVSKQWREAWSRYHVIRLLAPRLIPGFLEYWQLREPTLSMQNTTRAFIEAARKRLICREGKFRSSLVYSLADPTADTPFAPHREHYIEEDFKRELPSFGIAPEIGNSLLDFDVRYGNGRIVWTTRKDDDTRIVVDDLRTQTRRLCMIPHGDRFLARQHGLKIEVLAIGDELLVACMGRKCYAWHLVTYQLDIITLYTVPFYAGHTSVGKRVCIQLSRTEFVLWTFGHGLVTLDTAPFCRRIVPAGVTDDTSNDRMVILHPLLDNVLFILFTKYPDAVVFYELTNNVVSGTFGALSATFDPTQVQESIVQPEVFQLFSNNQEVGSAGLFGNLMYWEDPGNPLTCCRTAKVFNIFTKTISEQYFHTQGSQGSTSICAFWGSQLVKWYESRRRHSYDAFEGNETLMRGPPLLGFFDDTDKTALPSNKTPPVHSKGNADPLDLRIMRRKSRSPTAVEKASLPLELPAHYGASGRGLWQQYQALKYCLAPSDYVGDLDEDPCNRVVWFDEEFVVAQDGRHVFVWSFFTDLLNKPG